MILKWYDLVAVWFGSGTINHWKIHLRSNFTLSQNFHNFIKSATRTEVGLVRGDLGTAQDLRARFVLRRAVQPGKNTGEQGKHDATKANPKRQTQKRTKTNKTTGENTRTHAASTARPQSQPANRTSVLVRLRILVWLRKQVWSPQRCDQKQKFGRHDAKNVMKRAFYRKSRRQRRPDLGATASYVTQPRLIWKLSTRTHYKVCELHMLEEYFQLLIFESRHTYLAPCAFQKSKHKQHRPELGATTRYETYAHFKSPPKSEPAFHCVHVRALKPVNFPRVFIQMFFKLCVSKISTQRLDDARRKP